PTMLSPLSLHAALPIFPRAFGAGRLGSPGARAREDVSAAPGHADRVSLVRAGRAYARFRTPSPRAGAGAAHRHRLHGERCWPPRSEERRVGKEGGFGLG